MNDIKKEFAVASLGIEDYERRVLKDILRMCEGRTPSFKPYTFTPGTTPHIVLVDADKPNAMDSWQSYRRSQAERAHISPVMLSKLESVDEPVYHLRRPLIGTRLLALLERIVTEEHGYSPVSAIYADDKPTVPSAQEPAPVQAAPVAATTLSTAFREGEGMAALVVDDSLPVRIQMKIALQKLAKHVDFAETGEEALKFINSKRYDIIFLDVTLPGIDGYAVCRTIKRHPENQKAPVIMLAGNSSPADRIKGKLAGCDTYLIKPVRQAVFEEVVREFLKTPVAA